MTVSSTNGSGFRAGKVRGGQNSYSYAPSPVQGCSTAFIVVTPRSVRQTCEMTDELPPVGPRRHAVRGRVQTQLCHYTRTSIKQRTASSVER